MRVFIHSITRLAATLAIAFGMYAQIPPGKQLSAPKASQVKPPNKEQIIEDLRKRLEEAKKELKWNPRSGYWHLEVGLLYQSLKENDAAEKELRLATELDPLVPFYHYAFGLFMGRKGDMAAEEASLQKALALDPKNPQVRYTLALLFQEKGDSEGAEQELEKALQSLEGISTDASGKQYIDPTGAYFSIENLRKNILEKLKTVKCRSPKSNP